MTGYKLILVPLDRILALSDGQPQQATVAAESSVCNCDEFRAGPFEVIGHMDADGIITLDRPPGQVVDGPPAGPVRLRQSLTTRQGRKVPRMLYQQLGPEPADDDPVIGLVDTPELAALIVAAVNACTPPGTDVPVAPWPDLYPDRRAPGYCWRSWPPRHTDTCGCAARDQPPVV